MFSEDPALMPLSEIMPVLACEEMYEERTANGQRFIFGLVWFYVEQMITMVMLFRLLYSAF